MGNFIEALEENKYTCMQCNENAVEVTELYCFGCYLDREHEAMIEYGYLDSLWLTQEAN